jgi:hypothetical protein
MIWASKHILTWSSNPLNTTLACLHNGLTRQPGRCMLDVNSVRAAIIPTRPKRTQPSAQKVNPSVMHTVRFTWALVVLTVIWGAIVYYFFQKLYPHISFLHSPNAGIDLQFFQYNDAVSLNPRIATQLIYCFLMVVGIQAFQTMGLHSVELLANLSRDEFFWRHANTGTKRYISGASINSSSLKTAITSWQTILLFVLKPVIHWLFSISIITSRSA